MPNRRAFLIQTAAGGALILGGTKANCTERRILPAPKSLRILILGGTGFIGPHFVRVAIARGHQVSVFLRRGGQGAAKLPSTIEQLFGDRNGDLESIKNREWDAVLDLATYVPLWVRTLGKALSGRVGHYTFISTAAVYAFPGAVDERSQMLGYTDTADPYSLTSRGPQYGPLKALCEREAEKQFPGSTLVLRPGSIVGPGYENNPSGSAALAYWIVRMKRGGEILVSGDPLAQVQMIDVRDLAEWSIHMAENSDTGIFNTIGPAMVLGWAEMLGAIRGMYSAPMKLTWVPASWLTEQQVSAGNVLYWPSEAGIPGLMHLDNDKARAKGLTFSSLAATAAETLVWYEALSTERKKELFWGIDRKSSLEDSLLREGELLARWRTDQEKRP